MSPDAEISITPPAPIAPSPAAERMRNHRERRHSITMKPAARCTPICGR
jgi:hypothetical protein